MKSSKIVFFGNERLSSGFSPQGAPTLEKLIKNGYDVVAVVANFEPGKSRKSRVLEIQEVAQRNDIPVFLPKKIIDLKDDLKKLEADAGILVAYGQIIPQAIIDVFPRGIINIHPSLLPNYRGSTPVEQAILDGLKTTGVSLMSLVKAMDAGPIFAQQKVELTGDEEKNDLTKALLELGGDMLIKHLPSILNKQLAPTNQDESKATFCKLISKDDGVIDSDKNSAKEIERQIRAYKTWPKSRLTLFGKVIIVLRASVTEAPNDNDLILSCAQNTYLKIEQLIAPSGKTMSGADFIKGYKN